MIFEVLALGVVVAFVAFIVSLVWLSIGREGVLTPPPNDRWQVFVIMWGLIALCAIVVIAVGADQHQMATAFAFDLAMAGMGSIIHYMMRTKSHAKTK